ncbi:MAG: addB [Rhizobium sp.]|nr:addB [Rhizobium sp.]
MTRRIFTIPPGAPFLKVLARSLTSGLLVPDFRLTPDDPLSLARATIYVPTRRAARALRSEFVDLMDGRSAILPVIRPLGEIDDDAGYFDEVPDTDLELLPPVAPLTRLIELSRLILAWRNRLPDMLRDIHSDSPLVAPASPADAIWLARSLTELIDQVETEETGWEGLEKIDLGDRALWWQLTGQFLQIASAYWPQRLAELHRSSPSLHRGEAIRAEARRYAHEKTPHPVIVAGSTGSIPATADLIAAIHGLECGVVVLPGLDMAMSAAHWQLAGAVEADGTKSTDPASRSHPQYGLFHLLRKLSAVREDVVPLAGEPKDLMARAQAVSQAFTPAEADVNHREWRDNQSTLQQAFADVALVEAANEREEALTIAIALKLALSGEGDDRTQAALITPDRDLARRVTAELKRFGIEADDSAGTPLISSHHGALIRLLLESILRPGDPVALIGLLKHPLIRLGKSRESLEGTVNRLELLTMRGGTTLANPAELTPVIIKAIADLKQNHHKKQWQAHLLFLDHLDELTQLGTQIERAVEPLAQLLVRADGNRLSNRFPLNQWAKATGLVLEAFCVDERASLESLWACDAGASVANLLRDLIDTGDTLDADGPQWIDVMTALIAGIGIKPRAIDHPRVMIWGTLEARLQSVDTLILGGLNEGVWPGQTANNPFLSRVMKTEIGLEPPERRIGQSAHDFMMGLGTKNLILTRAVRQGGAPSVASRFLQRLTSVAGADITESMAGRGEHYRGIAARIDAGQDQPFSPRPEPKPDAALQPKRYSFSEAGKLRRDPYAIYAQRVLKLDPMEPFNQDPGALERGNIYHKIVERFVVSKIDPRGANAFTAIQEIARDVFDKAALPLHIDVIWRPRFMDTAREFLAFEAERRPEIASTEVEVDARMEMDGLTVSGRADRIDIRKDGRADIIDYKTGLTPSTKEARSLLDPQLSLEAAALKAGAFKGLKAMETENLTYVRLKPGKNFKAETVNNEKSQRTRPEDRRSSDELAGESMSQLIKLTQALKAGRAGFKSRVAPFRDRDYGGDYDHLARVAEWSSADGDEETGDE